MIVVAKFKGQNGSKGYVTGKKYELVFGVSHPGCSIQDRARSAKDGFVVYASMRKFLDNWEVVK